MTTRRRAGTTRRWNGHNLFDTQVLAGFANKFVQVVTPPEDGATLLRVRGLLMVSAADNDVGRVTATHVGAFSLQVAHQNADNDDLADSLVVVPTARFPVYEVIGWYQPQEAEVIIPAAYQVDSKAMVRFPDQPGMNARFVFQSSTGNPPVRLSYHMRTLWLLRS